MRRLILGIMIGVTSVTPFIMLRNHDASARDAKRERVTHHMMVTDARARQMQSWWCDYIVNVYGERPTGCV